jgi:hypothetical protein
MTVMMQELLLFLPPVTSNVFGTCLAINADTKETDTHIVLYIKDCKEDKSQIIDRLLTYT